MAEEQQKVMGEDKLPIAEFSPSMMVMHPSIIMIAKRGSGKSWVVRALLHHFRSIPAGIIIAPTDRMSRFYGNWFPESYIYYEYRSEIIERLLRRQKQIIAKNERRKRDGKPEIDTRCFIVMDDCLGDKKSWIRDRPIQELLYNGRHYHITYILTMQYPLGITPELRSNFDYIFLLAEDFVSNKKRIYEHYAGMFPHFDTFRQVFEQLTDDYGSMVIVNRGARANLFEKIMWYRAPALEGTRIDLGCVQFRRYNDKNLRGENDDAVVDDPIAFIEEKNKTKSLLQVKKTTR